MKNILYIIDDLRNAGAQNHLVTLIKGLDRTRFQPYVIAVTQGGRCQQELERVGIPVHVCGLKSIYHFKFFRILVFLIKFVYRNKIDIIHTYLLLGDILGVLAGLCTPAKVITSRREMGFWYKKHIVFTYRFLNIFTDMIIAVSNAVRTFSIEQEGILKRDKITVVYNGIDTEKFIRITSINKKMIKNCPHIPEDHVVFGVVANLLPVKGHIYFIEAFARLQQENDLPESCALLIGEGNLRTELEDRVRSMELDGRIFFLGSRNDVVELLELMDIFVLPSLAEGMSNALIEALFMGKSVITTKTGGNPEVVGSEAGLLVPPGDTEQLFQAMKRLLADSATRENLSSLAISRAYRLFSAKKMCRSYEETYNDLAA